MINDKKLFFPYLPQETYVVDIHNRRFLEYKIQYLELRNRSIQIVVITNYFVISNVGIKRFDCKLVMYESIIDFTFYM